MRDLRRAELLFHAGLAVFSLPPSLVAFLVVQAAGAASAAAWLTALAVIAVFQAAGALFRSGEAGGPLPLKLSYWTLKILQSMHLLRGFNPEKMVVAMSNRRALKASGNEFTAERTLILLPHCLQSHECPIRLTFNPDGCMRCGKCPVGGILQLRDAFGTDFAIASGGTSARRTVERVRPSLIIAVACPVDLSLGMLDVHPITTVGVLNQWRNGPCFDTWVDVEEVRAALELFLGE